MIKCKIDLMAELKKAGFSSYRIRKECIFGEKTMQKFRNGGIPSPEELNRLCRMLQLQPGDMLEYIPDQDSDNPAS